jgi:mannosylglycerate hydrolase
MDKVIDVLENDEDFTYYHFDGQTVVLEDYLEVKPQNRERLKALISSGRLIVGPWYTQPDEFAPDGESLLRNLLIGIDLANEYGNSMMIGHLPDAFGQSCQMPQILKGFDIDSALVMRGVPANKLGTSEFMWEGNNGDEILTIFLPDGYSNGMFLPKDKMVDLYRVKDIAKKLEKWASTEHLLLMNGIDHQFIQTHIPEHIKFFNETDNDTSYIHGSLKSYIDAIGEHEIKAKIRGELIAPDRNRVHTSIASTRMYQKRLNRKSQAMLEKYTEPICTMGWLLGGEYPKDLINQAWKILFKIQAHDSICGCATDEVHREIDQRFMDIENITKTLVKSYSRAIASRIATDEISLHVFNSAMTCGKQLVKAKIYTKSRDFSLFHCDGKKVKYHVDNMKDIDAAKMSIWTQYLGAEEKMKEIDISFVVDFDFNLGYKSYLVKENDLKKETSKEIDKEIKEIEVNSKKVGGKEVDGIESESEIKIRGNVIESEFYVLKICDNGSIRVLDKETGKEYKNLHVFEDQADAGDSYNFSPAKNDRIITSEKTKAFIENIVNEDNRVNVLLSLELKVPKELKDDGETRSDEDVILSIKTKMTMYSYTKRIDFETKVLNWASDHRLRVLFPSGMKTDYSYAETQFGTIKRSNTINTEKWKEEKWSEKPLPIYSMQRFLNLHNDETGITILNRGLSEYEVYQGEESIVAITLFRSVGFMGKADLEIRPGRPSGIVTATPDAQCIGEQTAEYAIFTHTKFDEANIHKQAVEFDALPISVQNKIKMDDIQDKYQKFFDSVDMETLTMCVAEKMQESEFSDKEVFRLEDKTLMVSAVKKCEKGETLILRLYNPTASAVGESKIKFGVNAKKGYVVNFGEKRQGELNGLGEREFVLPEMKAYTAKTFEFEI